MSKPHQIQPRPAPCCVICRRSCQINQLTSCSTCGTIQHGPCMVRAGGCGAAGCEAAAGPVAALFHYTRARLVGEGTGLLAGGILLVSGLAWLPVLGGWIPGAFALMALAPFTLRVQRLKSELPGAPTWNPLHTRIAAWMERNPAWHEPRRVFQRVTRIAVGANLALVLPGLLCLAGAPHAAILSACLPGIFLAVSYLIPHATVVAGLLLAAYLPTFVAALGVATPAAMGLALVPGLLIAWHAAPGAELAASWQLPEGPLRAKSRS